MMTVWNAVFILLVGTGALWALLTYLVQRKDNGWF